MPQKQWKQTTSMTYKKKPVKDRFLKKIKVIGSCWVWQAGIRKTGKDFTYGQFSFNGYPEWAHRVSYMLFKGVIPEGLNVCHSCDVPLCVNPDHLFLGTQQDNIQDMLRKQRDALRGERNPRSILRSQDIKIIRQMYARGLTHRFIASKFGVQRQTIGDVLNKRTWTHV